MGPSYELISNAVLPPSLRTNESKAMLVLGGRVFSDRTDVKNWVKTTFFDLEDRLDNLNKLTEA